MEEMGGREEMGGMEEMGGIETGGTVVGTTAEVVGGVTAVVEGGWLQFIPAPIHIDSPKPSLTVPSESEGTGLAESALDTSAMTLGPMLSKDETMSAAVMVSVGNDPLQRQLTLCNQLIRVRPRTCPLAASTSPQV